ncbi:multicopper oxidase family protein [Nocardioides cavernaquae]|uniref:Multicopper oxidase family protein n=1 Tax=Nocardioides cavernaquae TaxID=2321396 RepID=A0A3A5HGP7_9ACTN|nr:multicopper oxidase family protein [Nocardioides cavernaquae]RJS47060.1 multicopper oxidase family protein [Nocardioides cavernaquae]
MKVASGRTRLLVACGATLALLLPLAWSWWSSLLPATYDVASMGYVDTGGGPGPVGHGVPGSHGEHGSGKGDRAVADLIEDPARPADVRFTLTVTQQGDRILVNGTSPGPVLRVTQGQLIEATLVNSSVRGGTTLHWHGVDVPNAMDGVAGVTQDAVPPGERFVYRFVADRAGTYWYHAHQLSHVQVRQGLLGALVVEPTHPSGPATQDLVAVLHQYDGKPTLNGAPALHADVAPGEEVRVRLVNTDNTQASVWVTGAPYRVLAVDGTDLNGPTEVSGRWIGVTAGGRIDLGVVVPPDGVRIDVDGTTVITLGSSPAPAVVPAQPRQELDLLDYGTPAEPGIDVSDPERRFEYEIGRRLGFLDGRPGRWWTINGHLFPDIPMFHVEEGDVAVVHIVNRSGETHPMHLHGHRALVLSRDGEPTTGSPWWIDSLEVGTGEEFEIAFVADNPGIWMDHCHNLPHAAEGLIAHLMYGGVRSSYRLGGGNEPE